jgi:hypothetical protein
VTSQSQLQHSLLGIDEGRQRLSLIDTTGQQRGWTMELTEFPLARDMQRLGPDLALIGYERGFFELEIQSGKVLRVCDRWQNVTSACRLADGSTLVTGADLAGPGEINVLTLDALFRVTHVARRPGDYVRLMRCTDTGYLLCMNDHILETDRELRELRSLRADGFLHAWKAQAMPDGSTLVSAGYGAFMARFDQQGQLIQRFGAADQVPPEVAPFFYASFQVLDDGRILVANWQGHGPDNGDKGRQLLEFSPTGALLGSWSDPALISSLQGILVL